MRDSSNIRGTTHEDSRVTCVHDATLHLGYSCMSVVDARSNSQSVVHEGGTHTHTSQKNCLVLSRVADWNKQPRNIKHNTPGPCHPVQVQVLMANSQQQGQARSHSQSTLVKDSTFSCPPHSRQSTPNNNAYIYQLSLQWQDIICHKASACHICCAHAPGQAPLPPSPPMAPAC